VRGPGPSVDTVNFPWDSESAEQTSPVLGNILQQDRLSLIGYMASSAAHDISNPLATIAASAQSILAFWPQQEPVSARAGDAQVDAALREPCPGQQLREDLELILAEAKRAGEIVSNLLAFARDESPQWKPVSMAMLIRQIVALTKHHLNQRAVEISSNALAPDFGTPEWSWVLGDAGHLRQVVMNLIINAEQAIRTMRDHGSIHIRVERDEDDHVCVVVEDDGPGVPPTLHRTIFKAFYTTKKKGEGTGLGLSIAAGIISRHGGQLDVRDRDEGGATFSVRLPATQPMEKHPVPAAIIPASPLDVQSASSGRRGSVLLVDDEAGIRRSVGRFLRRFGCEVETVATGNEAVVALADRDYDAVVSDLRMPGLSGEQLFHVLQEKHPHMARRVVFTSGDMMRAETRAFLRQCGCPSLQKPYELGDLVSILDRMWSEAMVPSPTA